VSWRRESETYEVVPAIGVNGGLVRLRKFFRSNYGDSNLLTIMGGVVRLSRSDFFSVMEAEKDLRSITTISRPRLRFEGGMLFRTAIVRPGR